MATLPSPSLPSLYHRWWIYTTIIWATARSDVMNFPDVFPVSPRVRALPGSKNIPWRNIFVPTPWFTDWNIPILWKPLNWNFQKGIVKRSANLWSWRWLIERKYKKSQMNRGGAFSDPAWVLWERYLPYDVMSSNFSQVRFKLCLPVNRRPKPFSPSRQSVSLLISILMMYIFPVVLSLNLSPNFIIAPSPSLT